MFNLRNRSFLKEIDFQPDELRHLLRLAEALKTAKYAGFEVKRLEGKERSKWRGGIPLTIDLWTRCRVSGRPSERAQVCLSE